MPNDTYNIIPVQGFYLTYQTNHARYSANAASNYTSFFVNEQPHARSSFGRPWWNEPCIMATTWLRGATQHQHQVMMEEPLHLHIEDGAYAMNNFHNWESGELGGSYRRNNQYVGVSVERRKVGFYVAENNDTLVELDGVSRSRIRLPQHTQESLYSDGLRKALEGTAAFIFTICVDDY